MLLLPSFVLLMNVFMASATQYTPEVEIQSGRIRGIVETLTTRSRVRKYLGVPFARAERFELPVAPSNWTGVKDMTSFGKVCHQQTYPAPFGYKLDDMDEQCLNLNIYVPDTQSNSRGNPLPVMVWIHGGGYISNSNRISDGSYLATIGKVIVVTINYRLCVLGFLSANEYGFAGNYGLFDQIEALRWVNKNIQKFGGDPNQVTIFGNSAGGMSVSILSLSPLARGLFQNAIMQSGTANSNIAYRKYQGREKARTFFSKMGCSGANVAQVKNCIKALPAKRLTEFHEDYTKPVLDGNLLPDTPSNLVINQSHPINPRQVLIGVADDDGSCLTDAIPVLSSGVKVFGSKLANKKMLQDVLATYAYLSKDAGQNPLYSQALTCKYTTSKTDFKDVNKNRRIAVDVATDGGFTIPAVLHANSYAQRISVNTFFYQVEYGVPMPDLFKVPSLLNGYHETEKFMVFGFALKHKERECSIGNKFSREVIKMWSNFAKTGDPNTPNTLQHGLWWPQYDLANKQYLAIKPVLEVKSNVRPDDVIRFWDRDLRSLNRNTLARICRASGVPVPPLGTPPTTTNRNPPNWRF